MLTSRGGYNHVVEARNGQENGVRNLLGGAIGCGWYFPIQTAQPPNTEGSEPCGLLRLLKSKGVPDTVSSPQTGSPQSTVFKAGGDFGKPQETK